MARRGTVDSECIRQAAAGLLAALPPEEVTVLAVARAARVSTGTVYNYFRNKEHLLAAAAGIPGAVSAWVDPEPGQGRREHLEALAKAALERFRLIAGSAARASGTLAGEVEWLAERLAAGLEDGIGLQQARLVSRAFYGGAAAAVLLGWKREDDGDFASVLASFADAGEDR